ncbi:ABC transporter permease [Roseomonas eburnea]|uniref:ABC transporter permease n=1 Tax=Neoroseomonas eburnea TaxID=1346889 RepID=A0A9X9XGI0_9PROT|nr:ABC transporter permease [Neoroseomonas eburnea]MBR0682816.1 ABC transporter permease [Neoroseomonas eburnea]
MSAGQTNATDALFDEAEGGSSSRRSPTMRRFLRHRLAVFGLFVIVFLVAACAIGPSIIAYDPLQLDMRHRFQAPFAGPHLFGSDELGRDQLARLLAAGRISLAIGLAAMLLSVVVGTCVGLIAGFHGGAVGTVLMRIVDAILCFPSIFLLLTLAALIDPSVVTITLIVALTAWMEVARIVYGQIRALRELDFVAAAVTSGSTGTRIMFRELLPNAMGPIIVAATLIVARAILLESYVSYLGYGIQPPVPSWGNMLEKAQQYLTTAPWLAILPGLMITLTVASFNFVGDGLRDALDPRSDLQ